MFYNYITKPNFSGGRMFPFIPHPLGLPLDNCEYSNMATTVRGDSNSPAVTLKSDSV